MPCPAWLPCWSDWSSYYHFNYSGYRWRLLRDGRRWRSPSFSIASWPCYCLYCRHFYFSAFLGTINSDTNKITKHLFQGYLNIYNNYFKAPKMSDRTEANPNKLNQDDARYGFRCCHLKNIWTAPLPPETELSRQMTTSTTSIDIMGLQT